MRERIYYYPEFNSVFAVPGIILCIIGLSFLGSDKFWFLVFPLVVIGITLIFSLKAMVIDYTHKKLDSYTNFFIFKITNSSIQLNEFEVVSIVFERESARGGIYNMRRASTTGSAPTVISFEMYIYGFNKSKTFLCEFGSHAEARKLADKMAKHLNFKIEDTIMEGIQLYKKNPWKRRR